MAPDEHSLRFIGYKSRQELGRSACVSVKFLVRVIDSQPRNEQK